MSDALPAAAAFAPVAQRVLLRVWLRRWLALLGRTVWPAAASGLVLTVWLLITRSQTPLVLLWLGLVAWLLAPLILLWRRRPGPYQALALWDRVTGRREAFASAWWFERQAPKLPLAAAAARHLDAQKALLPQALPALHKDLPLQPHRWLWLPLALPLLGLLLLSTLPHGAKPLLVDQAMSQQALAEARKLEQTDWEKKKLEGLKAEEQKDLDKLKEDLKQTAQDLKQAAGKDAREVMGDLEKRAREAEKLAERLGQENELWASDRLTRALRQHADTADLGDAVAARNAAQTALAADAIAATLKSPQLTEEARERLNTTLKESSKEAETEDRKRVAGQHVLNAADHMQKTRSAEAGAEFAKLADKMRDLARREQTRKELEKLAQQLRDAGSNIAGQNNAGGMQQMAAAGQQGQGSQSSPQAPKVSQAQPGQQNAAQGQPLQPPGLNQGQGQQQQTMMANPMSGSGQQQQMMMAQDQAKRGQPGQQSQGQPMLMAPIPGAKPGEQPSALILGPPGDAPNDGEAVAMAMAGGREAGAGKADLNAQPTQRLKNADEAVVAAQQNQDGRSTVRAVEGGTRREAAERSASQVAADLVAAEEAALDEVALPPSRREQVRRYFAELRKRFEKQE